MQWYSFKNVQDLSIFCSVIQRNKKKAMHIVSNGSVMFFPKEKSVKPVGSVSDT